MLTFSKLGQKGHLGNQLFQIAATIGLAKAHGHDFGFNDWAYSQYFENTLPALKDANFKTLKESRYRYHQWPITDKKNYDIEGYLQSEAYFNVPLTRHYLKFESSLVSTIKEKYDEAFKKQTILISIRRGDFVGHPDYFQLPIQYYLTALERYFPKWYEGNLIVLSDDARYCKFHFQGLENVFFGDDLSAIEQLCLGSLCDHFIISNSTFSWWSAWLGETATSKTITPIQNFRGQKYKDCDDSSYFPKRWQKHCFSTQKIHLDNNLTIHADAKTFNQLKDYVTGLFSFKSVIRYTGAIKQSDSIHLLKPCYFPPMLLLQLSYLIAHKSIRINVTYAKQAQVNKYLSQWFFKGTQDFGVFSRLFSFNSKTTKQHTFLTTAVTNDETQEHLTIPINTVGSFKNLSGMTYYVFLCMRGVRLWLYRLKKNYLKG